MSGGSYNYECFRVENMANDMAKVDTDPRRAAFKKLLLLVAKAMHDIEWVDSGDCGPGDEHEAVDACFAFLKADPEIIKKAHAYDGLKEMLTQYFGETK